MSELGAASLLGLGHLLILRQESLRPLRLVVAQEELLLGQHDVPARGGQALLQLRGEGGPCVELGFGQAGADAFGDPRPAAAVGTAAQRSQRGHDEANRRWRAVRAQPTGTQRGGETAGQRAERLGG